MTETTPAAAAAPETESQRIERALTHLLTYGLEAEAKAVAALAERVHAAEHAASTAVADAEARVRAAQAPRASSPPASAPGEPSASPESSSAAAPSAAAPSDLPAHHQV